MYPNYSLGVDILLGSRSVFWLSGVLGLSFILLCQAPISAQSTPVSYVSVNTVRAKTASRKVKPQSIKSSIKFKWLFKGIAFPVSRNVRHIGSVEVIRSGFHRNKEGIGFLRHGNCSFSSRSKSRHASLESGTLVVERFKSRITRSSLKSLENFNVRAYSNITGAQLNTAFMGTGLRGLGSVFISAELRYHVNAVVLASIAALESSWGNSYFAKQRNNLFGYTAYTGNVNAAAYFSSKKQSIMLTARLLCTEYLSPRGKYYNGVTLKSIGKKYSTESYWASRTASVMQTIANRLL